MSPGEVAARVIVDFCLPMIQGKRVAHAPVLGRQLEGEEKAEIGGSADGVTMVFDTLQGSVFCDLADARALIWYREADSEAAPGLLDAALKRAYPAAKQLEEVPHPQQRAMRVRAYEVDLGDGKLSRLEVGFPLPGAPPQDRGFVVRVNALLRGAAASPGAAGPAAPPEAPTPPEPKKKKGWF
ncbi:MAG: hypothetical protein JNJ73_08710 [Hyphomonadaceae bacterium]|nr:hypothetical protein [Hyphomonadaceae bacterium]